MNNRLVTSRVVLSVAEMTAIVRERLQTDIQLRDLRVRGEITGAKKYGGTVYFTLKDATSMLNCVIWGRAGVQAPNIIDGSRVVVEGGLDVYAARGQYQLRVRTVIPDGDGADAAALEQLRLRLQAEGLFDDARKRPLPRFAFHIAVISSAAAAGYGDFVRVLHRRAPHIRLTLLESGVQGGAAVATLLAAFEKVSAQQFDAVALVRGGGARDDLRIFDDERVVRAIIASPVCVVVGVGHESDTCLADFAADLRASTPSDAATRFVAIEELLRLVDACDERLERAIDRRFTDLRMSLGNLRHRLERRSPRATLRLRRENVRVYSERLVAAMSRTLQHRKDRVEIAHEKLRLASFAAVRRLRARRDIAAANLRGRDPTRVLQLGYAIIRRNGAAIADAALVDQGDLLDVSFARGTAQVRVETVDLDGK